MIPAQQRGDLKTLGVRGQCEGHSGTEQPQDCKMLCRSPGEEGHTAPRRAPGAVSRGGGQAETVGKSFRCGFYRKTEQGRVSRLRTGWTPRFQRARGEADPVVSSLAPGC